MVGKDSKIAWTDHTFNPWRGCTKVSPGCKNCYAETMSARNPKVLGEWGPNGTRVLASRQKWSEPFAWNREAVKQGVRFRVFCASLADVFEDYDKPMVNAQGNVVRTVNVPFASGFMLDDARKLLWELIAATPNLDWQLLTKRPDNIGRMMPHGDWPNVWLGTSVESDEYLWRVDLLIDTPQKVPVRFISYEPALGPIAHATNLAGIQWLIYGGESGPGWRPEDKQWARDVEELCKSTGTAFFHKQSAGPRPGTGEQLDGRTVQALPLVG